MSCLNYFSSLLIFSSLSSFSCFVFFSFFIFLYERNPMNYNSDLVPLPQLKAPVVSQFPEGKSQSPYNDLKASTWPILVPPLPAHSTAASYIASLLSREHNTALPQADSHQASFRPVVDLSLSSVWSVLLGDVHLAHFPYLLHVLTQIVPL